MPSPDTSPTSLKREQIERELISRNMEVLLNTAAALQVENDELKTKIAQLETPTAKVNGHPVEVAVGRS